MENQTRAFLGDSQDGWAKAQLALDDVNGLWGGQRILLRGDGQAYLTLVDVSLAERHFWQDLGAEQAQSLVALAVEQDLVAIPQSGHSPVPDETATRISLSNAAGQTVTLARWDHDQPEPRFELLRDRLLALGQEMRAVGAVRIREVPGPDEGPPEFLEATDGDDEDLPAAGRILQAFIDFFTEDDWRFDRSAQKPILRLTFQGRSGHTWSCFAQERLGENTEQAIFYSVAPIKVPEAKRLAVAEFLTRANYGMVMGNFELDFSDGEIRYKTSIDLAGGSPLTLLLTKPLVYTNVLMMDKYLPGVMEVLYADVSPEQAIRKIEG